MQHHYPFIVDYTREGNLFGQSFAQSVIAIVTIRKWMT